MPTLAGLAVWIGISVGGLLGPALVSGSPRGTFDPNPVCFNLQGLLSAMAPRSLRDHSHSITLWVYLSPDDLFMVFALLLSKPHLTHDRSILSCCCCCLRRDHNDGLSSDTVPLSVFSTGARSAADDRLPWPAHSRRPSTLSPAVVRRTRLRYAFTGHCHLYFPAVPLHLPASFHFGLIPPPIQSCGPHSPSTTFIKSTPGGVGLFGGGLIATQLEGRHAVSIGIALTLCCCGTAFAKGDHFPRFCNGNGGKLCVMHSCNVLVVNLNF